MSPLVGPQKVQPRKEMMRKRGVWGYERQRKEVLRGADEWGAGGNGNTLSVCQRLIQWERSERVEKGFWLFSQRIRLVPALCCSSPLHHCPWCWIGCRLFPLSLFPSLCSTVCVFIHCLLQLWWSTLQICPPSQTHCPVTIMTLYLTLFFNNVPNVLVFEICKCPLPYEH